MVEGSGISTNDRNFGNLIKEQQLEEHFNGIFEDHIVNTSSNEGKIKEELVENGKLNFLKAY